MLDEGGDVLAPFRKGGHAQRHDAETVEQVLAETALGDFGLQVARSGGNDAHVHLDTVGTADTLKTLVRQRAQDAVLRFLRHVGDLVDEQGSAMRLLEGADTAQFAVLLDAEERRFHVLGRDAGRVDDDEGTGGTQRIGMKQASRQFLAGAGGAGDKHPAVGRRDAIDGGTQLVGDAGVSYEFVAVGRALLEVAHLAAQTRVFQRALGDEDQAVRLKGFFDVVVSAGLDRRYGGLDVAVPRDHDHGKILVPELDLFEKLQPVQLRALEPDVQEHHRGPAFRDCSKRGIAAAGGANRIPLVLEDAGNEFANILLVVDYEDVLGHYLPLSLWAAVT